MTARHVAFDGEGVVVRRAWNDESHLAWRARTGMARERAGMGTGVALSRAYIAARVRGYRVRRRMGHSAAEASSAVSLAPPTITIDYHSFDLPVWRDRVCPSFLTSRTPPDWLIVTIDRPQSRRFLLQIPFGPIPYTLIVKRRVTGLIMRNGDFGVFDIQARCQVGWRRRVGR